MGETFVIPEAKSEIALYPGTNRGGKMSKQNNIINIPLMTRS
jgi:hypothetical protein